MGYHKLIPHVLALFLGTIFLQSPAFSDERLADPNTWVPPISKFDEIKAMTDDPADLFVTYHPKKALPPELWNCLRSNIEEGKRLTAEIVGFRSPDLVGKTAPEIKPGKYIYSDLEKYPGLRELFPPELRQQIRKAGPPLSCAIEGFEIIPTCQMYWPERLCDVTKRNLGKAKLDDDGYLLPMSWEGGYPFPQPSGKFKAQEVYYNFNKRPYTWDYTFYAGGKAYAFDRNLTRDNFGKYITTGNKLKARTFFPPFGWLDKRAQRNNEFYAMSAFVLEPRATRGTITLRVYYDDPYKMDPMMIYVASLRRIRKMSATDTQDPQGDMAYDDNNILTQKITPKKYPYKFEITAEREYLLPIQYDYSGTWIDSKHGYALRGVQFMRRPCYKLVMTQLDHNYIYSKRVLYIDKENFHCIFIANYDQKGQLYRSQIMTNLYMSDIAQFNLYGGQAIQLDHVDLHSSYQMIVALPAPWSRKDLSMQELIKRGK